MTIPASGSSSSTESAADPLHRACRLVLVGRVQGVGFRPFVYRLALECGLTGWVRNCVGQVEILAQGPPEALSGFERDVIRRAPSLSQPRLELRQPAEPVGMAGFRILESCTSGAIQIHVPPDLFTCEDCLAELRNPRDRRFRYPFINCTQCGPRYTLIRELPYDRPNTTMAGFKLCPRCRTEYDEPGDRRFHAEPLACPVCGPGLEFQVPGETAIRDNEAALNACLETLRSGRILAVKGIGGYHLMCDAGSDSAITRLRRNKPRPHKPLAVLFPAPADDPLRIVAEAVELSPALADRLLSAERPIILLRRKNGARLSDLVAPGLDEIGVMLPYSPLHHLLLNDFDAPLVATSANISGEPVLTENDTVEDRLGHVAEAFLHHNRPIARPADDPVFRDIHNRARPLRLGRGSAPLELDLPVTLERPVLAVGGHMKNTVALGWQNRAVVSPHIGDMGNARTLAVFEQTIRDLQALYGIRAECVVCDAHPGYVTTRWAAQCGLPSEQVFHHHAHAATAWDSTAGPVPWLVFTWDGVGYGEDGSLWGGEALLGHPGAWQRFASLRPFHLPGGERAGREPWRSAAALCWETGQEWSGLPDGSTILRQAWNRRLNSPLSSAAGRLFDAAAALTDLCREASFEGQGPMLLEAACDGMGEPVELALEKNDCGVWVTDWAPLLPLMMNHKEPAAGRAAHFHASMARVLLQQARCARREQAITRIGFSGGVFQNRILTEQAAALLEADGFLVHIPEAIPVNDGGLCYGQLLEYACRDNRQTK